MLREKLRRFQRIPLSIILVLITLALIGSMILYSAAEGSIFPWAHRQLVRFIFGLILMLIFAAIDIRTWSFLAYPFYIISLFFLITVEILGFVGMGAQRWLDLYIFNLQPSELMKIALILALARYFHHSSPEEIFKIRNLILPTLMVIVLALLVMRQPDLGTAIILILCGGSLFFVAGVRLWKFAVILSAVFISSPILWNFLRDYQKNRILTFLNPENDPLQKGYQILQAKIALGSGGLWGQGFMQGTQSHLQFLPAKQTDLVFTMLCEEWGFVGGIVILGLYSILFFYGFRVALKSHHPFGRYLALGMTTVFFWYVFINIAMATGLLPVVGVPLPLLSYGGTALLTLMIGMGLIFSVATHYDVRIGR